MAGGSELTQGRSADRAARNACDRERLQRIADGGRERERAVAELFQDYRRPLLAFLARQGVSLEEGEDLLQDVFVKIAATANTFRGESAVSTWIYEIARNRLYDHYRARKPEVILDEEGWSKLAEDCPSESDTSAAQSIDDCVQQAFAQFARAFPERAEAVRRVAMDGWTIADVAKFLSRTEGATREYLSQCRKKLRAFLDPCRELLEGL
jgi:RNA polymerase sigma-70 factor (ECF subfamily)